MTVERKEPERIERYPFVVPITTRWMDNDVYGHVNNVVYYSYFDSAANQYLIQEGGLDIHRGPIIALVVESSCRYHAPVAYPDALRAGVRVDHLGHRAVTYGIGIFPAAGEVAVAEGTFVHVFVDRASRAAVAIPEAVRSALARIAAGVRAR